METVVMGKTHWDIVSSSESDKKTLIKEDSF